MSKGTIISNLGDGNYTVELQPDLTAAMNRISRIETQIISLNSQIAAEQAKESPDYALIAVLTIRRQQLERDKAAIQGMIDTFTGNTVSVSCADKSENLSGDVGLCDVPGENGSLVIYPGGSYNRSRDGIIKPLFSLTPYNAFLNLATQAAVRKWKPTYRSGTITYIDKDTDKASVALDAAYMGYETLYNINQGSGLSDVDVVYMNCNARAFEVGDDVIIEFVDSSWASARIIGFMNNPKSCNCDPELCENFTISGPESMLAGGTATINVNGGCPPYIWQLVGPEGWAIGAEETESPVNTITAGCVAAYVTVTLTDCEPDAAKSVYLFVEDCPCPEEDCEIFTIPDDWPDVMSKGQTAPISVEGGCGPYMWTITGDRWSLAADITGGPENIVTAGCGTGVITVKCACGELEHAGIRSSTSGGWVLVSYSCSLSGRATSVNVGSDGRIGLQLISGGQQQYHNMLSASERDYSIIWYDDYGNPNYGWKCASEIPYNDGRPFPIEEYAGLCDSCLTGDDSLGNPIPPLCVPMAEGPDGYTLYDDWGNLRSTRCVVTGTEMSSGYVVCWRALTYSVWESVGC